jgi:hypothetical protein
MCFSVEHPMLERNKVVIGEQKVKVLQPARRIISDEAFKREAWPLYVSARK